MASEDKAKDAVSTDGLINKISMSEWKERVRAFLLYGNPSQKMLVAEGEAGCGKSEITAQVCEELGLGSIICPGLGAQQMEEFLALTRLDTDDDGNGTVIQGVLENIIPTPRMSKDPRFKVTVDCNGHGKRDKVIIPWVIDECFTGAMGQMNQLRAALTFRKIGSVDLPPETFIIGTTNPETAEYSSRKTVDAAVMDRCAVFRVYMEFEMHNRYLAKLAKDDRYPEICRMFLRMDENKKLWQSASPRFWHTQFGLTWMELSDDPHMSADVRIKLFRAEIQNHFQLLAHRAKMDRSKKKFPLTAEALVARFKNFIKHGDDPKFYPISANKILDANVKEAKTQKALFDYWFSENQQTFIGVTIQDLTGEVCEQDDITVKQAGHIADLLDMSGAGLAAQCCSALYQKGSSESAEIFTKIIGHLQKKDVWADVSLSMKKHDSMSRQIKEEREELEAAKKGA